VDADASARDDDIVGSIDLLSILRGILQSAMLGYSVDATREGRGLSCVSPSTNGRVVRKIGFVVGGYARDYLFLNDAWHDGILVSLTNARRRPA